MTKKIRIEDTGILEIEIGNSEPTEIDVFDVVEEIEQRISAHRKANGQDDKPWIDKVIEYIQEKFGVRVSKLAALKFHNMMIKEYNEAADFFTEKPDSSSTSELTQEGLPKGNLAGD